ncbi:hypothetical protein PSEUBRA_001124 [Kalmanozyma brasiliensis GHG001]|uniref:Uncharacterized protein n=1 Tax=Kalmanozyma brasiliensis (strain GHG001) TaxID=1365824 RepID=V5EUV4_KALBG|nr:uncharacterized protein PSEUBRA_001124 [Kalmanozyma brasiliensis GHG001]EST09175.1 hypothetical protein PSEUBRA_001124 [Kalmanozyma brasiliensis GHG001]
MADAAQDAQNLIHNLLSEIVPYPVFRVLAGFSNLIYSLLGSSNNPSSWASTLLPPLITFFLAYFALVTAYRTVRSMLAVAWFGIKWGAIIGALIAIWAWWTDNTDAINSTGTVPGRGGLFGQLNTLGPLMNTLYTQLPDFMAPAGSSASRSNRRRTTAQTRRRARSSTRGGNQNAFAYDPNADLTDDLGAGYSAFADMFGGANNEPSNGVDFASLLRTIVTEGQRQGIDALSALRAAGRVQDELRNFQQNPTAWFEGVGERFRTTATPGLDDGAGYNTRSRARNQQQQNRGRGTNVNVDQQDSWWSNVASGVNDFLKREPAQNPGGQRRRTRPSYNV